MLYFKTNIEPKLPALAQLADGLAVRGLIDLIKKNPVGFEDLFIKRTDDITVERFMDEMEPLFSEKGSNKFLKEESTYKFFCDFIEKCYYDSKYISC